ncbi:MAG: response regulator, partial [Acidobacteriota bacterium]|nr:response regulator [Acidobacteriota bacterium]
MQKKRSKIMLVDDIVTNLSAGRNLLRMFYEVYPVTSAAKLFELLENVIPDLILLDIEMPEMDGYEAIKILKSNERFSDIPVIFLTSKTDENSELEGLNLGAVDYISKPFAGPLLLKRIETHLLIEQQRKVLLKQQAELKDYNDNLQQLVHKKTTQVLELQNAVMSTVAELVEFRDDVTGGHIARTQHYLKCLIEALIEEGIYQEEVSSWDLDFLLPSAQLHDVGKIAISDLILNKPGKLTPEEFDIMKSHVTIGVNALEQIENNTEEHEFMHHAKIIAGTH